MNYKKLGLLAGLEIHQQLDTKEKLFCRCPTLLRDVKESSYQIERYLRPVPSEVGEVDRAALEEFEYGKKFIYKGYPTTCLVENDEEPPREINQEALDIALEIALLLKMKIFDEIHTMRKIVIDGSNTCGFQRTALIAIDGVVETESGRCKIKSLCLEEDAAQKVEERGREVIYSLDRLGIPLVEIATEADINDPEHAREVAGHLGMVLRSTRKVKRGIGSIRQDINVSIRGGARTEIKGVQELDLIPLIVEKEVLRQLKWMGKRLPRARMEELSEDTYDFYVEDAHDFLEELLPIAKKYGSELSLSENRLLLKGENAREASKLILERANSFISRIPEDTRRALGDGSTEYMRPLPGPARMYPETDVPPVLLSEERISAISSMLPELWDERMKRYMKDYGLSRDLASIVAKSDFEFFERAMKEFPRISPALVVRTIISTLPELRREGFDTSRISEKDLLGSLSLVSTGKIAKEGIPLVLREIAKSGKDPETASIHLGLMVSEDEIRRKIELIVRDKIELVRAQGERAFKPLMGIVMKELRGKADGKLISKLLKEKMEEIR